MYHIFPIHLVYKDLYKQLFANVDSLSTECLDCVKDFFLISVKTSDENFYFFMLELCTL